MTPKQVIMLLSEKFGHDWINCEEPESISLFYMTLPENCC